MAKLTEQQVNLVDDALSLYFDLHFDERAETQEAAALLDLITATRVELAQSLSCAECDQSRMGFHSDLCVEHYGQLTRGELKVAV